MKSLLLAAVFVSAAGFAAAAQADTTATLASPVAKDVSVVAGDVIWACTGASCATQTDDSGMSLAMACRDLKTQLKINVTDLGTPSRKLSDAQIANCNK